MRYFPRLSQAIRQSTLTPVPVEDSLLLRVLVQVLVTLGISSVTVAAAGVTQTSWFNLLAVPLSAVGAWFSWRRRRYRNVGVKFLIALGMLVALGAFLARLVGQPGDTRIVLAELLIHLQVLHSFDLPRRKDLGYSTLIGVILLGVAATISQTLAFGPLLLLFLAVGLPVLVLDYRSRLGLVGGSWAQLRPQLSLGRLGGLLGVVIGLGLVIFLSLPRLPGYQVRSFPISSTVDFQGEFNGQVITNPGYVSGGSGEDEAAEGEGGGSGNIQATGKLSGPGSVNPDSYYGFNQQINQNLRGEMVPQTVMRVRSQSPGFWRVVAFDRYTGQGWDISRNERVMTLQRSQFSYQTILPWQPYAGRRREVIQTYTLVKDFSNLIPALYQARELYFPTREVGIDLDGTLRAPISLEEGMTYTVVSAVPYRDRTRLEQALTDYPDEISEPYLQVPDAIRARVRQQTEALLATSPIPLENPYSQALYLAQALKQRYSVQLDLPFFDADEDLVEAFLFTYEGGLPDHFSTVLTVMLRSIGVPARLVAGFGPGEFNPFTGFYQVRNTDAYALTEVYFPGNGWFGFDPIPGHELLPPSIRDYEAFSLIVRFWNWVAGRLPSPLVAIVEGLTQQVFDTLQRLIAAGIRLLGQGWLGAIAAGSGAVVLGGLAWLGWQLGRLGLKRWRLRRLPPMERLYQRFLLRLAQQGWPKGAAETPLEFSRRLGGTPMAEAASAICEAYVGWRYGGQPQNVATLQQHLRRPRRSP